MYIEISGGSITHFGNKNNVYIQMVSEDIEITLFDKFYTTEVQFQFMNYGEDQSITVGFPQWHRGTQDVLDFIGFECKVNGKITPFIEVKNRDTTPLSSRSLIIDKWYTREIEFKSHQITTTSVKYSTPYGSYGNGAEYLYGTGSLWKNSIETVNITIINRTNRWINELEIDTIGEEYSINNIDEQIVIEMNNVSPEFSDLIILDVNLLPRGLMSTRRIDPNESWYYDLVKIDEDDLKLLTKVQLRLLRNLLFAARGNIFESSDINAWLAQYCNDWYVGEKKVYLEDLSRTEHYNVQLILNEEENRR